VRGFGDLLHLMSGGVSTGNRPLDQLIAYGRAQRYTSLADSHLWHTLAEAERAQQQPRGWLESLLRGFRGR